MVVVFKKCAALTFGSKREPFIFWFKVLLCCFSSRFPVHWRNSLIVTAVHRSFLAPAAQVEAIICLHSCYETRYLTGEGQMQNRNLPYGVTSL